MPSAERLSSKFHSCPRSFASRPIVHFSDNYSLMYQPPKGVYLLNMYIANFVLPFVQTTSKIVLKCVPHVQHAYFSSFNKSYYWLFSGVLTVVAVRVKGEMSLRNGTWHDLQNGIIMRDVISAVERMCLHKHKHILHLA